KDRDREMALQQANYDAKEVQKETDIANASGREMRAYAGAVATQEQLEEKEVQAAMIVIEQLNLSGQERQDLALTGSVPLRDENGKPVRDASGQVQFKYQQMDKTVQKAAALMQLEKGGMSDKFAIIEATAGPQKPGGPDLSEFSQSISNAVVKNGIPAAAPQFGGKNLEHIAQRTYHPVRSTINSVKDGRFTSEAIVNANTKAIE